jgi:ribonuclease-3 family protein
LESKDYISAPAQSRMFSQIYDLLSSEEQAILRRGRNAKTGSRPKHVSQSEYQRATGLEALFGYLYLKGDEERLKEIFKRCVALAKQD